MRFPRGRQCQSGSKSRRSPGGRRFQDDDLSRPHARRSRIRENPATQIACDLTQREDCGARPRGRPQLPLALVSDVSHREPIACPAGPDGHQWPRATASLDIEPRALRRCLCDLSTEPAMPGTGPFRQIAPKRGKNALAAATHAARAPTLRPDRRLSRRSASCLSRSDARRRSRKMQPTNVETPSVDAGKTADRPEGHNSAIVAISAGAGILILGVVLLSVRASHGANRVSLEAAPRPVTVVPARSDPYRETRTYVGAVEPWVEASVGPQYISAYVATVLVRPGDTVKRGEVLATLDCSNPNAATRAVEMQARAADARVRAASDEADPFYYDARRGVRRAQRGGAEDRGEHDRSRPAPRDEGERRQDVPRRSATASCAPRSTARSEHGASTRGRLCTPGPQSCRSSIATRCE